MEMLTRNVLCLAVIFGLGEFSVGSVVGLNAQTTGSANQPESVDPCASPANKIVAENCRPGNPRTEWDVGFEGDPEIQGFATDMSVNLGETVSFKIRTH